MKLLKIAAPALILNCLLDMKDQAGIIGAMKWETAKQKFFPHTEGEKSRRKGS